MTQPHKVVTNEEWLEARKQLLRKEKEFTHLRDEGGRGPYWVRRHDEYGR